MKRTSYPFVLAVPLSVLPLACGGKRPPPAAAPATTEVDAAPPPVVDAGPPASKSLYDRLGGKEGVFVVVDSFTKNVLADPRVNKLFKKSKDALAGFKQETQDQICQLAGGPCAYAGKNMKEAHRGMGITDAQFDAVIEDLKLALDEKGASEEDESELFVALAPLRGEIVEKASRGDKKGRKK